MKICMQCGNTFISERQSSTNKYTTKFCGRVCAGRNTYLTNAENRGKPLPTKVGVTGEILAFIKTKGRYCTREEIRKGVGRSGRTLTTLGISTLGLNTSLGFIKPKSMFEHEVGNKLKEIYVEVETQKEFSGLVGTTGYPLRVDFYVPSIDLVVEADGSQHECDKHPWAGTNPNGSVKLYDEIKDNFFFLRGIKLLRIPYKRVVTLAYVKSFLYT